MPDRHKAVALPRVTILATGGTIAGVQTGQAAYVAGKLSAKALLSALPDLSGIAAVQAEQLVNIGSQSMTWTVWAALARRITQIAQAGQADAIVVTHGTDTMEETAYFLHLALSVDVPVVITGAMKPANAYAADGPINLYDAVQVAADPRSAKKGVLVVMNGVVHSARYVQKRACEGIDAFESRDTGPMGCITKMGVHYFYKGPVQKFGSASELHLDLSATDQDARPPVRVPVWYAMAANDIETLEALLLTKPAALVVAGVGNGNMSDETMQCLASAAAQGLVVARATRCAAGCVTRNLEVQDDAYGFVVTHDLNAHKARVLLFLALQKTAEIVKIQKYFDEH